MGDDNSYIGLLHKRKQELDKKDAVWPWLMGVIFFVTLFSPLFPQPFFFLAILLGPILALAVLIWILS